MAFAAAVTCTLADVIVAASAVESAGVAAAQSASDVCTAHSAWTDRNCELRDAATVASTPKVVAVATTHAGGGRSIVILQVLSAAAVPSASAALHAFCAAKASCRPLQTGRLCH